MLGEYLITIILEPVHEPAIEVGCDHVHVPITIEIHRVTPVRIVQEMEGAFCEVATAEVLDPAQIIVTAFTEHGVVITISIHVRCGKIDASVHLNA